MNQTFVVLLDTIRAFGAAWSGTVEQTYRLVVQVGQLGHINFELPASGKADQMTVQWYLENHWSAVLDSRNDEPPSSGSAKWATTLARSQYEGRLRKIEEEMTKAVAVARERIATIEQANERLRAQAAEINQVPWLKAVVEQSSPHHPACDLRVTKRNTPPGWTGYQDIRFNPGKNPTLYLTIEIPIAKLIAVVEAIAAVFRV